MATTTPPLPPPAHTAPLPPARLGANDVRILDGVPYAALPGIRPLELDLYLPPDRSSVVPVVVFLHGGGWRLGSRRTAGPAYAGRSPSPFERLAAGGIAVASIDYRLSGEAQLAGPVARRQGRRALAAEPGRRARYRPGPDRRLG